MVSLISDDTGSGDEDTPPPVPSSNHAPNEECGETPPSPVSESASAIIPNGTSPRRLFSSDEAEFVRSLLGDDFLSETERECSHSSFDASASASDDAVIQAVIDNAAAADGTEGDRLPDLSNEAPQNDDRTNDGFFLSEGCGVSFASVGTSSSPAPPADASLDPIPFLPRISLPSVSSPSVGCASRPPFPSPPGSPRLAALIVEALGPIEEEDEESCGKGGRGCTECHHAEASRYSKRGAEASNDDRADIAGVQTLCRFVIDSPGLYLLSAPEEPRTPQIWGWDYPSPLPPPLSGSAASATLHGESGGFETTAHPPYAAAVTPAGTTFPPPSWEETARQGLERAHLVKPSAVSTPARADLLPDLAAELAVEPIEGSIGAVTQISTPFPDLASNLAAEHKVGPGGAARHSSLTFQVRLVNTAAKRRSDFRWRATPCGFVNLDNKDVGRRRGFSIWSSQALVTVESEPTTEVMRKGTKTTNPKSLYKGPSEKEKLARRGCTKTKKKVGGTKSEREQSQVRMRRKRVQKEDMAPAKESQRRKLRKTKQNQSV